MQWSEIFEIISEASKNIERVATPEFLALNSDLPLCFTYDMRNLLTPGYYKVDLEVVWKSIEADLPNLKTLVEKALVDLWLDYRAIPLSITRSIAR